MSNDAVTNDEDARPWWQRLMPPWVWKGAVIAYAIYIFALIAFYMLIAGRSISYSYTISGQPEVVSGQSAALRVGVFDIHRGLFLPGTSVEVSFVRGDQVRSIFRGQTSPAGLGDVNLKVPEVEPGPATWQVRLEPIDMDPQVVKIPITVESPAPGDPLAIWVDSTIEVESLGADGRRLAGGPPDEGQGPLRLELLAEGGMAIDGLRSTVFVQATERATGVPVKVSVQLVRKKGMVDGKVPEVIQTNRGGLGAFSLVPIGAQEWELKAVQRVKDGPDQVSTRVVRLDSKPTQYAMALRDPVWEDGEDLEVGVRSLHRSGALYGDVHVAGRWTHGEVTGLGPRGGGFILRDSAVPRPKEGVELARVQVYGDALNPGAAGDTRLVALPAVQMSDRDVLKVLLGRAADAGVAPVRARALAGSEWLLTASQRDVNAQIAYWLSLLPRELNQPPLLKDTQDEDKQTLADEKESYRAPVTQLLIVSGGLALLIILFLVVTNFVRVRRESQAMMAALEADELLEGEEGLSGNFARTTAIFQLVLLFATIVVFFAAIVVLLQAL